MPSLPTLIVVSGPAGSGKTTLAHAIASAVGCPAICRDEIKEGVVHARRGDPTPFVARTGDELTARTLPVFFGVLEILLRAGVTTVAEAAFQDHVWRPRLEPLLGSAQLRIVHCVVDADVARGRIVQRARDNPLRRAHADPHGIPGLPSASASTARPENKVHEPKACEPASSLSAQVNAQVNAPANAPGNRARATRAPIDGAGGTRTP
jgi:predicted kinase